MKVILFEDVERLGKVGDVVTVKDGYARNYLIPKNKVKLATPANLKIQETLKKKKEIAEQKTRVEAEKVSDRISSLSITINAQAGEEDKLYGSITSEMVSSALEQEGIHIDKKDIVLDEPIKKLGVYQVVVKVHPEVKANLRVWVVKK